MTTIAKSEFRVALLSTAAPLSILALAELVICFVPAAHDEMAMFWVTLFAVCLIVLAGILTLILALAGYSRWAKGVIVGDGIGLLAMALVWTAVIIVQP